MSAPTFPMAAAAEQAAAALAAAEQRGAKAAVAHLRSVIAEAVAELPVWPEGAYQTPMSATSAPCARPWSLRWLAKRFIRLASAGR
jgi:hypothetical protein